MKALFQRFSAFFLAALLIISAVLPASAQRKATSAICSLGTDPSDMLSGGGRRVQADEQVYYIGDSDGAVYAVGCADSPVVEGPVMKLNYANGKLYFARDHEKDFDLCVFDLNTGKERILLKGFSGSIGQLYLVDEQKLVFSSANAIWELPFDGSGRRLLILAPNLCSFVPTGCGIVYATGKLFDYTLYADETLLAQNVERYTVRFDLERGLLCYTSGEKDYQMDLAAAFAGTAVAKSFVGDPEESVEDSQAELPDWTMTEEESMLRMTGAIADSRVETEDPAPVFGTHQYRQPANKGTLNIVRRARQMLNVKWTPLQEVGGWGYTDESYGLPILYEPEVTYTGLPYGQGLSYVPWYTSLTGFVNAVNDIESKFYTERCTYWRGSQYYGTDCSGFASWAWQTTANGSDSPQRKTCQSIINWDKTAKIGRSYTLIQLGDALISSAHAVLVTDVTYSLDGTITSIELSQANPTTAYNGCCYSTRYSGTAALQTLNNNYFVNGSYSVYRNTVRDTVTYKHDCAVPLEGDVCSICGCGTAPAEPDPSVSVGIDVSEWNVITDWSAVAEAVDFAIVRVGWTGNTEGGINDDSSFVDNVRGCIESGIPFGLYYYAGATTPEKARAEADAVLEWLNQYNFKPSLPIFYDVEEDNNILTLPDAEMASVISAFCSEIEDFGFRSGVYASASLWDNKFKGYECYGNTVHWVAHWGTEHLTVDLGASVWQYTSKGTVPGITGNVDMDYWIGPLGETEHPSTAVLTPPTCQEGKLTSTCVICGRVLEQPIRGGAVHTPGRTETKVEIAPTCTETGVTEIITYCSVCGEEIEKMVTTAEPLGHNYVGVKTAPTCTEGGYTTYTCSRCEDSYTGDETEPSGHAWKLTEVLTEGETLHESTGLYTCDFCKATKEAPLCAGEVFVDMPEDAPWAHDAIDWALFNTVTCGTSYKTFSPYETLTRGQAMTFLWVAAGRPEPKSHDNPFEDVRVGDYFLDPVLWAVENNYTAGTSATTFSPYESVTTGQMITFLWVLAGRPIDIDGDPENPFDDVSKEHDYWYHPALWAYYNGILVGNEGNGSNLLAPRTPCTRAYVVTYLYNYFMHASQSPVLVS